MLAELGGTEPWHPRGLAPDGPVARVALVQSAASLLGGDDVRLEIELADGCVLEMIELSATVGHHARRGPIARLRADVALGAGARLIWLAPPMILAAGCQVQRETRVSMASPARALLREAFVFGRTGEESGAIVARTRITLDGAPLLDETLDTSEPALLRSTVVAGDAAMLEALTLAGMRDENAPPEAMQAHGVATLWRGVGPASASAQDHAGRLSARWRSICLG